MKMFTLVAFLGSIVVLAQVPANAADAPPGSQAETATQAEIFDTQFVGVQGTFHFSGFIKNTGKVTASYSPTLIVSQGKKTFTHHHPAMSIAAGKSANLEIKLKQVCATKGELKVLEVGKSVPVTKAIERGCPTSIP